MDHDEEGLLERVLDGSRLGQQQTEALIDQLRDSERVEHGAADRHFDLAQATNGTRIMEQVLGQQRVKVLEGITVEPSA
jgi:hypothetical protein